MLFFVLVIGLEYGRSHVYMGRMDRYGDSAPLLGVKNLADRLAEETESNDAVVYCAMSSKTFARSDETEEQGRVGKISAELHELAKTASPSPSFNSLVQFIPGVRTARTRSIDADTALKNIVNLTSKDVRSTYCTELVNVLRDVYFIDVLRTPQGVSALHISQLENFKVSLNRSQDVLRGIAPPAIFAKEHTQINTFMNDLRLTLHSDASDYKQFSRRVELHVRALDATLIQLSDKSSDLLERPQRIITSSATFR